MFKKILSLILVGITAMNIVACGGASGGGSASGGSSSSAKTAKASNYKDSDFKDYFYCYVDDSGILHFTSKENKGKFVCVKDEDGCRWGDMNLNRINFDDMEVYNYIAVEHEWFRYDEEITIDDKIMINFGDVFAGNVRLKKINNVENIVTTNMSDMFYDCKELETLDLSKMDVSNVTNMAGAFMKCDKLKSLNVSTWNISKVKDMTSMFYGCYNLENFSVENWDVSNVEQMTNMFRHCKDDIIPSWWDKGNIF